MDYKLKIDKLVGLLLEAVENEQSSNLILDSNIAYDVAKELLYELDANFEYQDGDCFDELLEYYDILSLCLICSEDGDIRYTLQPVFDEDGMTYTDEDSEVIYIQDSLYDCIDENVFYGQIAILIDDKKEFDRVIEDLKKDDSEEDELDDLFEELVSETFYKINNGGNVCPHCIVKEAIKEIYEIGLHDGKELIPN